MKPVLIALLAALGLGVLAGAEGGALSSHPTGWLVPVFIAVAAWLGPLSPLVFDAPASMIRFPLVLMAGIAIGVVSLIRGKQLEQRWLLILGGLLIWLAVGAQYAAVGMMSSI